MYTNESGVKMPKPRKHEGLTNFLRSMNIGDSFVCEKTSRTAAWCLAAHIGVKLKSRKETETTIRVWRVE